ncbi:hypothetical protein PIB30_021728 [Stylosanthes scabra]|uniref:Uncharacterized protein n=1 Tax=Stylosanthes scabra TaxID=79078 RepID=A0ABU6S8H6_9FABA|nr:hypothetical protein [Stylosanthes scabra]
MSTDHRLLHYMLSYLWFPRKGNHGVLTEEDVFIMRAMIGETELNWPYLLAYRLMHYASSSLEPSLGHGMLWTKIFEHFMFDLSNEEVIYVTEENAITSRSLNKMGRGAVVDRKGKKNKAVAENALSQSGTSFDSQVMPELTEMFAEKMHVTPRLSGSQTRRTSSTWHNNRLTERYRRKEYNTRGHPAEMDSTPAKVS